MFLTKVELTNVRCIRSMTLPLEMAFRTHAQHENEVTMVLRSKGGPLQVDFDESTATLTMPGSSER